MMCETGTVEAPSEQASEPAGASAESTQHHQPQATPETASPQTSTAGQTAANGQEDDEEFLRKLPPEIGTLLVMIGVAGVFLPGVIGTPLIVAGAVVVWPKTFEPLERKFAKMCPGPHREGLKQIKRFIHDLNRRFPDT